jgi:hypothetical protein
MLAGSRAMQVEETADKMYFLVSPPLMSGE